MTFILSRVCLFLNDRPPTRQLTLGANAFLSGRRFLSKAVILKIACPLARTRRLGAILAQIHAHFLFLGHKVGYSRRSSPLMRCCLQVVISLCHSPERLRAGVASHWRTAGVSRLV